MELQDILSVSGMPGLFKLVATRNNGLVVEDFDSGKRSFISLRKQQITPLGSVGIYTYTDVVDLKDVFTKMHISETQPSEQGMSSQELHGYMREILPEFDEQRVHLTDMKKLVKWYHFLSNRELLQSLIIDSDEEE